MSVAQTKAARRKIAMRYGGGKKRSVADAVAAARAQAAREAKVVRKK